MGLHYVQTFKKASSLWQTRILHHYVGFQCMVKEKKTIYEALLGKICIDHILNTLSIGHHLWRVINKLKITKHVKNVLFRFNWLNPHEEYIADKFYSCVREVRLIG